MKKLTSLFLALNMVLCVFPAWSASADDSGSEVLISSANELIDAIDSINQDGASGKQYRLTEDINLGGRLMTSYIGSISMPFAGTFDGDGHTIENYKFECNDGGLNYGLFGAIGDGGTIKNVGVKNVTATFSEIWKWIDNFGGLVGAVQSGGTVDGCFAKNVEIIMTFDKSENRGQLKNGAGIAGSVNGGIIKNCYALNVSLDAGAVDYDAGVVGRITSGSVSNCYSDLYIARSSVDIYVDNCYYSGNPDWPWSGGDGNEHYSGEQVSPEELKTKEAVLGASYGQGAGYKIINDGYPALVWELGEKYREGAAAIVSSTPENNAENVEVFNTDLSVSFNRFLKAADIVKENITVQPAADFTISTSGEYTDKIDLSFKQLELGTEYKIGFSSAIETFAGDYVLGGSEISFKTVDKYPDFNVVSSTPANNAKDVNPRGVKAVVKYSLPIDEKTVTNENITVSPEAEYTAELSGENEITVSFPNKLSDSTTYTITLTDGIKSTFDTAAPEYSLSFTTMKGFENLIVNGDMEDTSNMNMFSDKNNYSSLSYQKESLLKGKPNSVLRLSTAWGDQPVVALGVAENPGTYYMAAWVKAEKDQDITLCFFKGGDNWDSRKKSLKANEWTYVSEVFNIPSDLRGEEISIRSLEVSPIYIDDWCIYDVAKAPQDALKIQSSSVENGAVEVSPYIEKIEAEFNVPVKFSSLLSGISISGGAKISKVDFDGSDLYKCTVYPENLAPNKTYTLDFGGVEAISGKSMTNGKVSFTTVKTSDKNASVVKTLPADNAAGVKRRDFKIEITFDSPMNPETYKNISTAPDLGVSVSGSSDLNNCILTVDGEKFKNNTEYTVTVPDSVKTVNGYSANTYSFKFKTVGAEDVVSEFNAALKNEETMKNVLGDLYTEIGKTSASYEYITSSLTDALDTLCKYLAAAGEAKTIDDVFTYIDKEAFRAILATASDTAAIDKIISGGGILDDGILKIYTDKLGDSGKAAVIKAAVDNKNKSFEVIKEAMTVKAICSALSDLSGAGAVEEILKLSKDSFTGSDDISDLLSKADSSTYPSKIYAKLQGLSVNSLSAIKSALKSAVDSADTGKKSSSGGGGGSSSGGSKISAIGSGSVPINPIDGGQTPAEEKEIFSDLGSVEWAKSSIEKLYKKGIINGKSENTYAPNDALTRAEFVKLAVLALDTLDTAAKVDFADINENDWFYSYAASAYNMGIIKGIDESNFAPNMQISREDMAVILARAAEKVQGSEEAGKEFADAEQISDYAKDACKKLSALGVIKGDENGCFNPKGVATRAEAAVVFDRFLDILQKS